MVERFFVERKYDNEAANLQDELKSVLKIDCKSVRKIIRYDVEGLEQDLIKSAERMFASDFSDILYRNFDLLDKKYLIIEFNDGQYDQRADNTAQCLQLLTFGERPVVACAVIYLFEGITSIELQKIKNYLINPVESKEGSLKLPDTLKKKRENPTKMRVVIEGFIDLDSKALNAFYEDFGFAMTFEDLCFVQNHFAKIKRNPTLTELKVIDTYWSDHCRHTTFLTEIKEIIIHEDNPQIKKSFESYQKIFDELYKNRKDKYVCLMDIATLAAKKLKKEGYLNNLDESEEINACSVVCDVDNDGVNEEWLIMFKNETHNHPTEIEPYGGAATCLGGAIRDPLSGRAYVYQAMRITGAGNPLEPYECTIEGKLPQKLITKTALSGFSSYSNQIGLASSVAHELYHDRFKAKRLEAGYVIGGAPKSNVIRKSPKKGDVVILLGGDTGRDGCGGATSSSKAHTSNSAELCGAEVQKGNPLEERKILRLFKRPEAAQKIIKCNDFGAGGVSVAIGELARGLDIRLERIITKYEGLTATELAISESQERMAIVCERKDMEAFIALAKEENLKATPIATITDSDSLRMYYKDELVVDIDRKFLDTNGVKQCVNAEIEYGENDYFESIDKTTEDYISDNEYNKALYYELAKLNNCSQKGMGEVFDSTVGAGSVLMPFGGKLQLVPSMIMASKPPVAGYTKTVTCSSFGIYPELMIKSPYIGAIYSVIGAVGKLIASGVKYETIRLSLQEYFKKLNKDPKRWGEPLSALLGAFDAQINLKLPAIGGKDSMSGTYEDIDVPPTLIAFAMGITSDDRIIHNAFGEAGNIYRFSIPKLKDGMPDYNELKDIFVEMENLIADKAVKWAAVEESSFMVTLAKSLIGNVSGAELKYFNKEMLMPSIGNIIAITNSELKNTKGEYLGTLNSSGKITSPQGIICIKELIEGYTSTLSPVFKNSYSLKEAAKNISCAKNIIVKSQKIGVPKVIIPVFPGTNSEMDTAKAFADAGAKVNEFVICNNSAREIEESIRSLKQKIDNSQILALPGGSSAGDEPNGGGKFIEALFRHPMLAESIQRLIEREGLILGIGNGFQALLRLGLLPYSKVMSEERNSLDLVTNTIARNVSAICRIKISSNNSPWLSAFGIGDIFSVPISHSEGRFAAADSELENLIKLGLIATQYVDSDNNATMEYPYNPSGSLFAIEGLISSDGKIFGKMGHTERVRKGLYQNVSGNYEMDIFANGVKYFG